MLVILFNDIMLYQRGWTNDFNAYLVISYTVVINICLICDTNLDARSLIIVNDVILKNWTWAVSNKWHANFAIKKYSTLMHIEFIVIIA